MTTNASRVARVGGPSRAGVALAFALAASGAAASPAAESPAAANEWVSGAEDSGEARVEARIVIDPATPRGEQIRAGVAFRVDPGWHIYWKNPGDAGLATRVDWRDAEASELAWPAPRAFSELDGEIVTYGYAGDVLLASWLTPAPGAQQLAADVELLACRTSCIPASLALSAPLAPSGDERAAAAAWFAAHDAALPLDSAAFGAALRAERAADGVRLVASPCRGERACAQLSAPDADIAFFPEASDDAGLSRAFAEASGGDVALQLSPSGATLPERVRGVLRVRGADGALRALAVDTAIEAAPPAPQAPPAAPSGLLAMLGLALLGGLVLNLMPCVLPVLAMKVFAVGELAGHSRRKALQHGVAYAGGIALSMLALASAALALRSAGHAVGWGFQFQEPAYVAAISAVLVGFALNLFGVFEIGFQPSALAELGADAPGARRSFFEGLLAVALATPCSAPFLGTAIGFAFASSAAVIVSVFLAIGAGLALPFVAISAFPRLGRFMPRSGAWMGTLRSGLGFALLATVVWLLWIVGRSVGIDSVAALLGVLLAGAFVGWIYGRLQHAGTRFAGAGAAVVVAALVFGGANLVRIAAAPRAEAPRAIARGDVGAPWSPSAVRSALGSGRPALVVFSADWCLTCKLNERIALDTDETQRLLASGGFAVLRGDWTQRDEAIRAELARWGKAGVPLYLVYSPDAPERPLVLPEVITQARLTSALRTASR